MEYQCDKCKKTHDGTGIYCEECDYSMASDEGIEEDVIDMFDERQ